MPKSRTGGRRGVVQRASYGGQGAAAQNNQQTQQTAQQIPTPAQAAQSYTQPTTGIFAQPVQNGIYLTMTDADSAALYQANAALYQGSGADARKQYISKQMLVQGRYSLSQDLNYHLNNDIPFANDRIGATEKFMAQYLQSAAHQIGQNVVMHRGAHEDVLTRLGVKNYENMSNAQLKQTLVGKTWQSKAFDSMAYDINRNPFLTGSQAGGREVVMEVRVGSTTRVISGAVAQSEWLTAIGTNYRVVDASFTGKTVTPHGTGYKKQVKIVVETW